MMKTEVMKQLKAMGTAQNRKGYARHGIGPDMCGVSFANLRKLISLSRWGTRERRWSERGKERWRDPEKCKVQNAKWPKRHVDRHPPLKTGQCARPLD